MLAVCVLFLVFFKANRAALGNDYIVLTQFNETLQIIDETYVFGLVPIYQVPLNIVRHTIYTGTTAQVQAQVKRALVGLQSVELSPNDFEDLILLMGGTLDSNVKRNLKKRSLPIEEYGVNTIRLAKSTFVTYNLTKATKVDSKKRVTQGIIGTTFCLHIPFFTTCDNSQDIQALKNLLVSSTNEIQNEISSFEATANARQEALSLVLNKQSQLIQGLIASTSTLATQLSLLSSIVSVNAASAVHGDYMLDTQINSLQRQTDSLLRYANALASTDPREITASPSLTELFKGYKQQLQLLEASGEIPIVSQTTFNWTEQLLPMASVSTVVPVSKPFDSDMTKYHCFSFITQISTAPGGGYTPTVYVLNPNKMRRRMLKDFYVLGEMKGNELSAYNSNILFTFIRIEYVYGPIHYGHPGIYQNVDSTNPTTSTVQNPLGANIASTFPNQFYCIFIFGYTMLASWNGQTPYMLNGNAQPSNLPLSNCDDYRLKISNPGDVLYHYYVVNQGVLTPFYSNCDMTTVSNFTSLFVNYYSSWPQNIYIAKSPSPTDIITGEDVNERHYISEVCFTNLEPEWMSMVYWVNTTVQNVTDIPFGYDLDQFTINPNGSLSSSLQFIYTSKWVDVYSIQRISTNKIIVDEVTQLEGDSVLFYISGSEIVDESDSFFGMGNNGRDCVRLQPDYNYDLLGCFFQNNQKSYTTTQYLTGQVQTTGIARFIDKFSLTVFQNVGPFDYTFQLIPRNDSDFTFHIETDGVICPQVLSTVTSTSGCVTTLFYSGTSTISLTNPSRTIRVVNDTAVVPLQFGETLISVETFNCVILTCQNNLEISTVLVQTPDVTIISQSDLDLQSKVNVFMGQYSDQINNMTGIQNSIRAVQKELSQLSKNLSDLNFNISQQLPFQNDSNLTATAMALAAAITTSSSCGSPFSSVVCAFEHIGATVVFLICISLIFALLYVILDHFEALPYAISVQKKVYDSLPPKKLSPPPSMHLFPAKRSGLTKFRAPNRSRDTSNLQLIFVYFYSSCLCSLSRFFPRGPIVHALRPNTAARFKEANHSFSVHSTN